MDIVVVWYRSPATGVGWWPTLPLPDDSLEAVLREKTALYRRFKNKGGVETMVKRYVEVDAEVACARGECGHGEGAAECAITAVLPPRRF